MSTEGARSGDSATPNPVRAEQPEGKGATWAASFRKDARDYAIALHPLAEAQPGTVIAGVVALLDDIAKLPDPFASAPAAPGAAVGVDGGRYYRAPDGANHYGEHEPTTGTPASKAQEESK